MAGCYALKRLARTSDELRAAVTKAEADYQKAEADYQKADRNAGRLKRICIALGDGGDEQLKPQWDVNRHTLCPP